MEFERKTPWHEIIRQERLQTDHELISWEVVAEGAIVSVSKGPSCSGVWVFMFGGPEQPNKIKGLPYMEKVNYFKSDQFPTLKTYHNCPDRTEYENVETNPEGWIEDGIAFVEAVSNMPRE